MRVPGGGQDLTVHRVSMLQIFEVMQSLFSVEEADVASLGWRKTPNRPAQMNEVRLYRRVHRVHSNFTRQAVGFASVARAARRYDVGPLVRSTA